MTDTRLIWFDGKIMPVGEAKINVLSPSSQFGANVFEGIRCYWNSTENQLYAFRLEDHIRRLEKSSKLFRLENKYSHDDLIKYFLSAVIANNFKEDIAVRQTVFVDGFGSWFARGPVNMFIAPIEKKRLDPDNPKCIKCCISSWQRINENSMSPKVKVGANYINSRVAQLEAIQNNYDSTIFLNNAGKISEGPGSCLFIVKDKKLITPPITASILESITRETIIEIASKELNIEVIERDIDRTELYIADEAFLCGSAIEIAPINNIDGFEISDGRSGEITRSLHKLYLKIVSGSNLQFKKWLTPIYK